MERMDKFSGIELKLDVIDLAKLEPKSPPFRLVLSVSPNEYFNDLEVDKKITEKVIFWTNTLSDSMNDTMLSLKLHEQSMEMLLLILKGENLEKQILETAIKKMENLWPQIMDTIIRIVKEETNAMLSAFKGDLDERMDKFSGIELKLDVIDLAKLEPKSPPFRLVLSVSPNEYFNDTKEVIWALAVDLAVQFQEKVKGEAMRLSLETAGRAEMAARASVRRFRENIQKEIRRLKKELESKQEFIESHNQKLNEMQIISDQLKDTQDKIEESLLDKIATKFGEEFE